MAGVLVVMVRSTMAWRRQERDKAGAVGVLSDMGVVGVGGGAFGRPGLAASAGGINGRHICRALLRSDQKQRR